jgi:hypothetical protein
MTGHPLLQRQRPESCLSDLMLDRWLANELAGRTAGEAVRSHLVTCRLCRDRLRALEAEPAVLPVAGPALTDVRASRSGPRPPRLVAALSGAAALAAGVALFVGARSPPETAVRAKGDLQLELVVRHPDGRSESVLTGDALAAGDVVQFSVSTPDAGYPFVVGLDAAGAVSPYWPAVGRPARVPAGRAQTLPGSVSLDESLGAERFLLLHCNEASGVEVVVTAGRRALAAAGGDPRRVLRLDLPCRQVGLTIEKVRRP